MPIAVQCSNCQKGMGVPSKYAGKTVKCPDCKAPLKIPAAAGSAGDASRPKRKLPTPDQAKASAPARRSKPQRSQKPQRQRVAAASDSGFLDDLDLDGLSGPSSGGDICPKCAEPIAAASPTCPNCGYDTQTGSIDQKFLRRKRNKGPDPSEFYKESLGDAKTFSLTNFLLVKKTATVWTLLCVLAAASWFMVRSVEGLPTRTFWVCFMSLCIFGIAGWFWSLGGEVMKLTMRREEAADRLNVDFFATLAIGIRAVLWPFLMGWPIWGVALIAASVSGLVFGGATFIGIVVATYLGLYALFPIAQVHRQQKYTYKSAILWELVRLVPANIGPLAFVLTIATVMIAPFVGIAWVVQNYGGGLSPIENKYVVAAASWTASQAYTLMDFRGEPGDSWLYKGMFGLLAFLLAFPAMALLTVPAAFPAVFLMRLNGSFGLFNKSRLGLINKLPPGTPATFWVRILAFATDLFAIPFTSFIVVKEKYAIIVGQLLNAVVALTLLQGGREAARQLAPVWFFYNLWMYYAVSESTTARATIGKETYGLVVVPDVDEGEETQELGQMDLKQASIRFLVSLVGPLSLLPIPFHPEKKALNDLITNTRTVFRGDR